MEEQEYRLTYQEYNQQPCPFEKAILSSRCTCEQAQKLNIAEREAMACLQFEAQQRCIDFLQRLQQKAQFALQILEINDTLAHGKKMKLQCGGMLGLQAVLQPEKAEAKYADNIFSLLNQAIAEFESLDNLPYGQMVPFIRVYKHRTQAHSST